MTGLTPYLILPGTARPALEFYRDLFGGEAGMNTFAEFGREDGPGEYIAHGMLSGGPVTLFASDAGPGETALRVEGLLFALLGTAEPAELERWFAVLAETGMVIDPLQERPWGAHDGTVTDRFGVTWLIGYEGG
ncbi:VOC family protein [Microbacterium sp.]|uniref:VOC family protein n=1 Tax=Microbacterium sp. TaxID=51671 RepID=UPI0037C6ECF8